MAARGRKPLEEELRRREQIESLYLSGLRTAQIRDALASAQNPTPIELSLRQVQAYVAQIKGGWAKSLDPAQREAERAELVAEGKDVIRVAAGSSARYRGDAIAVGYLNTELKAIERVAKLLGLDAPAAGTRGGHCVAEASPFATLSRPELEASIRHLVDLVAATP